MVLGCVRVVVDRRIVNASAEARGASLDTRFGFESGYVIQEFGYDDDVDLEFRAAVEAVCGEELEDEEYNYVSDAAIVWWRDDDGDSADLTDLITDSMVTLDDGGNVWVLIPKAGRDGHVPPAEVEEAAGTAGMNTTINVDPGGDWLAFCLTSRRS